MASPPPGFTLDAPPAGYRVDPPPPATTFPAPPPQGFTIDKPPAGFTLDPSPVHPTGDVHDGDTLRLSTGANARLSGVDAFELSQTGRGRNGAVMPLGPDARTFLQGHLSPSSTLTDTGTRSYDRPVMILRNGNIDVNRSIIDNGMGLATPEYLRADPRLGDYMEAERLARLNRRGAFAGQFQSPADYRHHVPSPWAAATPSDNGKGDATFFDDPTPFQGLRPEIASGYVAVARDPKSTAADLVAYAKQNGFMIRPEDADKFIKARVGKPVSGEIQYDQAPQVLTNPGDGMTGAALRGLGDPINMLDEAGGVVDTLGGTPGRENVWSSDRRFGDILYNNINQNRDILRYDDAYHPYSRFGGQLASGFTLPAFGVEGVGLNAARTALRSGVSRYAAEAAAKAAVRNRLFGVGAAEGAVAGFGAGEGNPLQRAPSALIGAGIGGAGGLAVGTLAPYLIGAGRRLSGRIRRGVSPSDETVAPPPGFSVDPVPADAPMPIERPQAISAEAAVQSPTIDRPSVAGMDNELTGASISAPVRNVDRINIADVPPPPPGFTLDEPQLGRTRPMSERASPEDMAQIAGTMQPGDVRPIPGNQIESLDEAVRANPGAVQPVVAPDERAALPSFQPGGKGPMRKDPLDLVGFLRSKGGIREDRGELAHMGVTNNPRDLEFTKSERFLGKLVKPEGMPIDEAALQAWEAGYFPDHIDDRPSPAEFLDALRATYNGGSGRVFHPDDFASIDAYRAAQSKRYAVEGAEHAGRPLVEDIGTPASMSDLDANQPPATAYEDLPAVGGKAGNIRLDALNSSEDIRRALMNTDAKVGGFDAARRGRISQAETEALAREMGMTADDLLKRRQGQALNAEQALAARSILAKSADELVKLAGKADGGSDADLAAFRAAWLRHAAIQEQVSGATAEAGRALAQFKQAASSKIATGRIHKILMDDAGGRETIEDAARAIVDLQAEGVSPEKVNKFASKVAMKPPTTKDKLIEWYYNALLSNVPTHVVNTLSNTLTAALQVPEHATAAAMGGVRNALSSADVDRVLTSEVGARMVGLMQGTREGLAAFARTARTGQVMDQVTKVEARVQEAIPGKLGKAVRTPTRLLAAEDELFKGIARRMEINGLAVRKATAEGLKGEALKKRIADLSDNPTDEMFDKALDYARYVTFQTPLGPGLQAVSHATNRSLAMKMVIPFIRTPTNIFSYALERSPLAPMTRRWRADFAAGGARRDLAVAKVALGTGLGMMVAQWAADGKITGAQPRNAAQADVMKADGWQPYSVKIGDRYVSYSRLDPIATTLSTAADLANVAKVAKDGGTDDATDAFVLAILDQIDSKTFISGLSDIAKALDPRAPGSAASRLSNYAGREAASFLVPAIVAQGARSLDPMQRDPKGFRDQIQARLPIASQSLPAKTDIWGQPVPYQGAIGPDMISPFRQSRSKGDLVNQVLLHAGAGMSAPNKTLDNGRITLNPDQLNAYKVRSGQLMRGVLAPYIGTPDWQRLTPAEQKKAIDALKGDSRSQARQELFGLDR